MSARVYCENCEQDVQRRKSGQCPRCGRMMPGNQAAFKTGSRSRSFWERTEQERLEFEDRLITEARYTRETAPAMLEVAARTAAQAFALQKVAYRGLRKARRLQLSPDDVSYRAWLEATTRLDWAMRVLEGLRRPTDRRPMAALADAPEVDE